MIMNKFHEKKSKLFINRGKEKNKLNNNNNFLLWYCAKN